MYDYAIAKTQKAKSVLIGVPLLQNKMAKASVRTSYLDEYLLDIMNESNKIILITSNKELESFISNNINFWSFARKLFVRPCPLTPKHGFVESRVINNHKELAELFTEVKKVDSDGEIIIMPFIDNASANAVLTSSGLLSIGPNHNGATGGKSSFSIPVKPFELPEDIMTASGLKPKDNVFIEAVFSSNNEIPFQVTQIRGGPAVNGNSPDFIPKDMIVQDIINPIDDLLHWEKIVKTLPKGTVVYGKNHTLASHAAIHCVINNIPFNTSFQLVIGKKIHKGTDVKISFNQDEFLKGVFVALNKVYPLEVIFHISASILHNWVFIRNSKLASFLLGISSVYMCQCLIALCYGEYRHSRKKNTFSNNHRENVYTKVIDPKKFINYMSNAYIVANGFVDSKQFPIKDFGGPNWSRATKMAIKIWNSIVNIQDKGIFTVNVNRLILNLNKSTNLVHNGGWLFNKFSRQDLLNRISEEPGQTLFELSDYILELNNYFTEFEIINHSVVMKKLKMVKDMK